MADGNDKDGRVVVVGYDGSAASREAVRVAAQHAGKDGKLYIVHVYPPPSDWLGHPNYDRALRKHEEEGQEVLDQLLAEKAELGDTAYATELLTDTSPAVALANVASARKADEIVVGKHGVHRLRDVLGGVPHDLLHGDAAPSDVPVIVVEPPS